MPLDDDLLELTDVTPDGARIRAGGHALDKLTKITAGSPCDACPLAAMCRNECGTFRVWVKTGKY